MSKICSRIRAQGGELHRQGVKVLDACRRESVKIQKKLNANDLLSGVPDGLTEEDARVLVGEEVAVVA